MRFLLLFVFLGLVFSVTTGRCVAQETIQPKNFVICYNPDVSATEFSPYAMVVVDYAYPPDAVAELRRQGKVVFGYLSLAKVHQQSILLPMFNRSGSNMSVIRSFLEVFGSMPLIQVE